MFSISLGTTPLNTFSYTTEDNIFSWSGELARWKEYIVYLLQFVLWTGCVLNEWILSVSNILTCKAFSVIPGTSQTSRRCLTPVQKRN